MHRPGGTAAHALTVWWLKASPARPGGLQKCLARGALELAWPARCSLDSTCIISHREIDTSALGACCPDRATRLAS
eukprot:scaffold2093_cov425-Prasinococcus_capsulatus_cf.AAC.11